MHLRHFIAPLLGLVLSLMSAAAPANPLVVATDTAFVPFEFKQGDRYTGFDIDLWAAIAEELDISYRLQPMDFNGIIPGLQTRSIDVALAGITIREDRQQVVDFSEPYYDSGLSILVRADNEDIHDTATLAGKTVAVKTGTVAVDYLHQHSPSSVLKLFPNIDNAYLELATGRVDAAVHDTPNVQYYANTAGQGRVKVVRSIRSGDQYGIAFPKGSNLVPRVNQALAALQADGRYDAIYQKWFGTQP